MPKAIVAAFVSLVALSALVACNTLEGAGQDISGVGRSLGGGRGSTADEDTRPAPPPPSSRY